MTHSYRGITAHKALVYCPDDSSRQEANKRHEKEKSRLIQNNRSAAVAAVEGRMHLLGPLAPHNYAPSRLPPPRLSLRLCLPVYFSLQMRRKALTWTSNLCDTKYRKKT